MSSALIERQRKATLCSGQLTVRMTLIVVWIACFLMGRRIVLGQLMSSDTLYIFPKRDYGRIRLRAGFVSQKIDRTKGRP